MLLKYGAVGEGKIMTDKVQWQQIHNSFEITEGNRTFQEYRSVVDEKGNRTGFLRGFDFNKDKEILAVIPNAPSELPSKNADVKNYFTRNIGNLIGGRRRKNYKLRARHFNRCRIFGRSA
jgi:hypothetical protein